MRQTTRTHFSMAKTNYTSRVMENLFVLYRTHVKEKRASIG